MMKNESYPKILVVDDEFSILAMFKCFMERNDYTGFYASDIKSALYIMERENPDPVFLDLGLGEESGIELCRQIRQKHLKGKVVAMSGLVNDTVFNECRGAGFDYIVSKPIRLIDLEDFIQKSYGCKISH